MNFAIKAACAATIGFVLAAGAATRAEAACGLTLVGSYDMVDTSNGEVGINIQIGSETKLLLVDTGAWFSFLSTETVGEMKLPTRSMGDQFVSYDAYGGRTSTVATAPSITIGPLQVTAVDFVVAPPGHKFGKGVSGLLGANVLKHFDIELDFAKKKLNFFDPDHCPGQVVYWTQSGSAHLPFKFDGSAITLPVQLDGKELWAQVDTGAFASTLSTPMALQVFGLSPTSPKVVHHDYTADDGSKRTDDTYTFDALYFGGISISNPPLHLIPDTMGKAVRADYGRSENVPLPHLPAILLGIEELRHLHLYIAYQEKVLYVTAADAH